MYVDKNGVVFEHIHLIEIETGGYLPGWYFSYGCSQLHGPFSTLEESWERLVEYVKALG